MRRLYLLRHGETEGQSSIRFHGNNDVPLAEIGRAQVRAQIARLTGVDFAAVVHSPLSRARESAQIVSSGLRPVPRLEVEPDLREVHFGRIEGLTEAEIAVRLPEWYATWKAGEATGYPDGETHGGFAARVARAFDTVLARHVAGPVLIVAHKGVIKRGLQHLLGWDHSEMRAFDPELGSLTIARFDAVWRLEQANLPAE